ncbi:MAG: TRAP transporter small permease [Alphaproteobacteria bacterium]|nr:TRAP transporter small permease [Alphaproteobacteria bacterium]
MKKLRSGVRAIVRAADALSGALLMSIVVINLAAVFMRYVLLDSISWSEEGIRYLSVWMTFLGATAASWLDEHMDMNMLADHGGPMFQRCHRAILHALTAVFSGIVLWQGTIYCRLNGMQTAPTTGLPMLYVYGALAVGGALLLVVSLVKIYDQFDPPEVVESGNKAVL